VKDPVERKRRKRRFIVEIRYPIVPEFLDLRGRLIGKIHPQIDKTFKNWQADLDSVLFTDDLKEPRAEFYLDTRRTSVVFEDPPSVSSFLDEAKRLLGFAYDQFGGHVRILARVGVRFIEVVDSPAQDYEALVAMVLDKFHKQLVGLPLEYTDSQVILVHKYGRYAIGPTKKGDQWLKQVFKDPASNVPDFGFAVDVDSFAQDVAIRSKADLIAACYNVLRLTTALEESLLRTAGALDD
jgi:hypothetical protein